MNSVEFAIKDGVPYAIDFTNPAPDMHVDSILPQHFEIVVEAMAGLAVSCVKEGDATAASGFPSVSTSMPRGGARRAAPRASPRGRPDLADGPPDEFPPPTRTSAATALT